MSRQFTRDFLIEVAKGNIAGHAIVHKFGRNPSVGTSYVPLTIGGLYNTPQVAGATTLRVKAGNANDTAAGTGAREITMIGLDETGAEVTEAVATAGASASSATSATFMRLYRAYVSASGTYATASAGSHAADIVIENGAGGTDWMTIDATDFPRSQSEVAVYTVPINKTGYVMSLSVFTDSTRTTNILFFKREAILQTAVPYDGMRLQLQFQIGGGQGVLKPRSPITINGPGDVGFMAKVEASTAEVAADFEILVVDD